MWAFLVPRKCRSSSQGIIIANLEICLLCLVGNAEGVEGVGD